MNALQILVALAATSPLTFPAAARLQDLYGKNRRRP